MTPTNTAGAKALSETALAETSLVETQWGGRIVASAFVVLASGLSWVFAATAMIG
ncbi:hypothetical protein MTX35_05390 [Rhodococcus sp. ARC_M12]|uniref:hypothetical protein n=1 Tax=Rhodococcus sp. ARC_M12 TaxID=2928854 RepID=UPI001FB255F5|nr:hypothetical protein [Rhodococcus sp. ARC_M12]MCJ0977132.1 hypothetical protein [Rhodococcus sp. ARC_M12]